MNEFIFKPRNIYYRINDFKPDRKTIVFVHGLSGSSSAWFLYENDLKSTFNILSFDLRGHGKSEKPHLYEDYKIDDFADDLFELTEYLKIQNFILIGHSLGSLIVLAFLKKHQDKVAKTIFLAPNFSVKKMLGARIVNPFVSAGVSLFKRIPFSGGKGKHIDYSHYPNSGDWNIPRMIADISNTTLRVYLYATKQTYAFDGENFLAKISTPTLIIHGKKDTIFPVRYGALMASKIPGAELVLLEDADHILVLNKHEEIMREILNFINK